MSDTPRTAKAWGECLNWLTSRDMAHDPQHAALANLAEDLERELVAANAKIAELKMFLESETLRADAYMEGLDIERASLAAAKEMIAELENHLSPQPVDERKGEE